MAALAAESKSYDQPAGSWPGDSPGDAKRRPELDGAAVHRKASGAFSTMRQLGGAFGVAILVAVSGRVAVGQVSSGAWGETPRRLPGPGLHPTSRTAAC
jgi:hypothetical protein